MKRRDLFACGSAALGALFVHGACAAAEKDGSVPVWTYEPIDAGEAAQRAYDLYGEGSCMYATFRSIVSLVGEKRAAKHPLEAPQWNGFPYYMMAYGKGGVHDFGSLCGSLNGAAAAISLFVTERKDAAALTYDLFNYYENTLLPSFEPASSKFGEITQSVSESVLCHISVTRWASEADETAESPRRKERCKRLVGDITARMAEMLNRYFADGKKCPAGSGREVATAWGGVTTSLSEPAEGCTVCHNPEGEQPQANVKMNCAPCHSDLAPDHGK